MPKKKDKFFVSPECPHCGNEPVEFELKFFKTEKPAKIYAQKVRDGGYDAVVSVWDVEDE